MYTASRPVEEWNEIAVDDGKIRVKVHTPRWRSTVNLHVRLVIPPISQRNVYTK